MWVRVWTVLLCGWGISLSAWADHCEGSLTGDRDRILNVIQAQNPRLRLHPERTTAQVVDLIYFENIRYFLLRLDFHAGPGSAPIRQYHLVEARRLPNVHFVPPREPAPLEPEDPQVLESVLNVALERAGELVVEHAPAGAGAAKLVSAKIIDSHPTRATVIYSVRVWIWHPELGSSLRSLVLDIRKGRLARDLR